MNEASTLRLTLLLASDEGIRSAPLAQLAFRQFFYTLWDHHMKVPPSIAQICLDDSRKGEFVIPMVLIVGPALATAINGWFAGHAGRRLRVKLREIEVEANSDADLRQRLEEAIATRERQADSHRS